MEHLIWSSLNAYFASCTVEKTNNVFCWVLQAYESGQYLLHECCHPDSLQLAQLCFGNGASLWWFCEAGSRNIQGRVFFQCAQELIMLWIVAYVKSMCSQFFKSFKHIFVMTYIWILFRNQSTWFSTFGDAFAYWGTYKMYCLVQMHLWLGLVLSCLQDLGSLSTLTTETVYVALLHVFRDLKRAGRYETVNPSVLKWAFAKQQSSFLGCIQQV